MLTTSILESGPSTYTVPNAPRNSYRSSLPVANVEGGGDDDDDDDDRSKNNNNNANANANANDNNNTKNIEETTVQD